MLLTYGSPEMKERWERPWLVLACAVVLAGLWTTRREYHACDTDGCVVANRWTGAIYFEPALYDEYPEPGGTGREVRGPADRDGRQVRGRRVASGAQRTAGFSSQSCSHSPPYPCCRSTAAICAQWRTP